MIPKGVLDMQVFATAPDNACRLSLAPVPLFLHRGFRGNVGFDGARDMGGMENIPGENRITIAFSGSQTAAPGDPWHGQPISEGIFPLVQPGSAQRITCSRLPAKILY